MKFNLTVCTFLCVVFSACSSSMNDGTSSISNLLIGEPWLVKEVSSPKEYLHNGIQFVDDKQVFNIDSQGRAIMSVHAHTYDVSGDTLTIVDHSYTKKHLKSRGTQVYLIQSISNNKLSLHMLYPDTTNRILLERVNE